MALRAILYHGSTEFEELGIVLDLAEKYLDWLKEMLGEAMWRELVNTANSTDPMKEQVVGDPEHICKAVYDLQDALGLPDGLGLLSRANPKNVAWAKRMPSRQEDRQ